MNKRMRQSDRLILVSVLIMLVLVIGLGFWLGRSTAPEPIIGYEYTVQHGDSLWSLAANHVGTDKDIREWIHKVQEINGINVNEKPLQPGQRIVIYRG